MIECQDDLSLIAALKTLWNPPQNKIPLKVSLWLSDLVPNAQHNGSFFENPKSLQLSKTLDSIQQKFGRSSIYFAGSKTAQRAAPLRIAFTNIPDIDIED